MRSFFRKKEVIPAGFRLVTGLDGSTALFDNDKIICLILYIFDQLSVIRSVLLVDGGFMRLRLLDELIEGVSHAQVVDQKRRKTGIQL
jgi:hypothetical protein